jgi:cholest-4-en-3-one 26-monooxygenase
VALSIDDARPIVDLLDPEFYRSNPHDVWAWMRANEPVYRDERNGLWGITRYDDVMFVERRAELFPSHHAYRAIASSEESNMIAQDDPGHKRQRRLVQHFFAPGAIARREPEVRAMVRELLDAVLADGEMEVVDALAAQLPARLTCILLGFDEDYDWENLKGWSESLMRTDMRDRDGAVFIDFFRANLDLLRRVERMVDEKRADPEDDLLSVWATAELDGHGMALRTIFHEAGLFVAGGAETTRTAIAHGIRAFCDHPADWEAMAEDPSLVPGAVEEVLRWVTPLNNFFRRCMGPAELSGQRIAAGDRVIMLYPSANRDEAVFANPHTFDIRRSPNPHIAFGNGPHTCIGAPLARMTLRVVFEECAKAIKDLRVIAEPDVEANIFARAVKSFRLGFTVR